MLRSGVPLRSIFCNYCTTNSYCFCLYKEKNFLEWHSPAEYLQLNPCKIDLVSRILLPDSSASPQRGGYSSNVVIPRDASKNLPAHQGKRASLSCCGRAGGKGGRCCSAPPCAPHLDLLLEQASRETHPSSGIRPWC